MSLSKRILLIDDDSTTSTLNKMIIERSGLVDDVMIFTSALKALEYLTEEQSEPQTDLILLDINMPVMNGWEFVQAYTNQKNEPLSKIVILSSSIDPVDISRAEAEPIISEFQSKPLSVDVLQELVGKYLNGNRY